MDINAFETDINDNESPDIEMIDEEIDRLIAKGLEESRWANTRTVTPSVQIKSSLATPTPFCQARSITPSASEEPIVIDTTFSKAKKQPCPPELQAVVEAEERRAVQMAANLEVCTAAMNGDEAALALNQLSPARVNTSQNHSVPKTSTKSTIKKSAPLEADMRLFLRIAKDHDWRLFAPCGVRELLCSYLKCAPSEITKITRTPTGFALNSKDEEIRLSPQDSYWNAHNGGDYITEEITRVTNVMSKKVRLHEKTRAGALYRSWLTHFIPYQVPRPGFRCSRAPTCEKCSSTFHLVIDCKAPTRCRDCGGLHRSDSRDCLARPSHSGPVTKNQLHTIRQMSQREYHAIARVKAAVIRAEAEDKSVETASIVSNNDQTVNPTKEVTIYEGFSPTINLLSINVGRWDSTHDLALSRAYELEVDILLIQEPWWSGKTKSHSGFDCHEPFGAVNFRPRAIIYTRRDNLKISAHQIFSSDNPTGDYCWVVVNGITFLNVCKAPNNTPSIQTLITWSPPPMSLVIGDFNSVNWA
ncbi:hypothetical protein EPUL_004832 [Erysiphe pulchra]|uniref:Endonuclease/exonuclease/phosphatase domain-containing protein n=1 Tax=Erysiphe pulchra TaxID=225359 RepID=A0A2S4PLS1_9PEZI|nr:hypothetical protein EPUL_004832 [Erysiphe pulchra]